MSLDFYSNSKFSRVYVALIKDMLYRIINDTINLVISFTKQSSFETNITNTILENCFCVENSEFELINFLILYSLSNS